MVTIGAVYDVCAMIAPIPIARAQAMSATNGDLTPRQERFCQECAIDLNATGAARRAGYSEKTAHVQGPRLSANVRVAARIDQLQIEATKRNEITADRVLQMLIESYRDAKAANQHGPAVRAVELLGKHLAMFVDRQQVSEVGSLSYEQLIEQIAEGDPERRAMAQKLFTKVPRSFEEGANDHTRNLAGRSRRGER